MKKKILLGGIAIVFLGIFILHTQVVEKPLLNWMSRLAAARGYQLSAIRMDLNLARLQVGFQGIRINAPGLKINMDRISINASLPVLTGKLAFDHILLFHGILDVNPDLLPKGSSEKGSAFPAVSIGLLECDNLILKVNQTSSQLDLELAQMEMNYADARLHAAGTFFSERWVEVTKEFIPPDRQNPYRWDFNAETTGFLDYNSIEFQFSGPGVDITVKGSIQAFEPDLVVQGTLNISGPLEVEPIELDGSLGTLTTLNACTQITTQGHKIPVFASLIGLGPDLSDIYPLDIQVSSPDLMHTDFFLENSSADFHAMINMSPNAWMFEPLNSYMDPDLLSGMQIQAGIRGRLIPEPAFGGFLSLKSNEIDAFVSIEKSEQLMDGYLFVGTSNVESDHHGFFKATCNSEFTEFNASIQAGGEFELEDLPLLEKPISNGYFASLDIEGSEAAGIVANHLTVSASVPGLIGFDDVALLVDGSGSLTQFACQILIHQTDVSNAVKTDLIMNLDQQTIEQLTCKIMGLRFRHPSANLVLNGSFQASGPLVDPDLNGMFDLLALEGDVPLARIIAEVKKNADQLEIKSLRIQTSQISAAGIGDLQLGSDVYMPPLGVDSYVKLHAFYEHAPGMGNSFDAMVPQFSLSLFGDLESMSIESWFPPQSYPVNEELDVSLESVDDDVYISGVQLLDPSLYLRKGHLVFSAQSELVNAEDLNRTLRALTQGSMPEPLQLNAARAFVQFDIDLLSMCPQMRVEVQEVKLDYAGVSLELDPFALNIDQWVSITPVHGDLEGNPFQVIAEDFLIDEGSFKAQVMAKMENPESFNRLLHEFVPSDFELERSDLTAHVTFDIKSGDLGGGIELAEMQATLLGVPVSAQTLSFGWENGISASADGFLVSNREVVIEPLDNGFLLYAEVPGQLISLFNPEGAGVFDVKLKVQNTSIFPEFDFTVVQMKGAVQTLEPELEIQNAVVKVHGDWEEGNSLKVFLSTAKAEINGGDLSASGILYPLEGMRLDLLMDEIKTVYHQSDLNFSGDLTFRTLDQKQILEGFLEAHSGNFFPEITIDEVAELIAPAYPYLNFPDPLLENVLLDLELENLNPLTISHEFGYFEITIPSMIIQGTLAEPELQSGFIHIEPDSYIKLGKEVFLFKPSDVLFQPERPGEPYLQIFMEYGRVDKPKTMQITGYSSDLEDSPDATSMTSFFASFLLGKYTNSLLSLEYRDDGELTDSSFSAVIEKQLGSKVYTRYVVPLDLKKETQRVELGFGPFSDLFLSASQTVDDTEYQTRKTFKFGREESHETLVEGVRWNLPEGLSRKEKWQIKRKWTLKKQHKYSPGRLRQAKKRMHEALKAQGYFKAQLIVSFEDDVLNINCDPGLRFDIESDGLMLSSSQLDLLRRHVLVPDRIHTQRFSDLLNTLIVENGYKPGSAQASWSEHSLKLGFFPGPEISDYQLNFTEANRVMSHMLKDAKWRKSLVQQFLLAPRKARERVKGWLAAMGYLQPHVGKGAFDAELKLMTIPVHLGPRAELVGYEFYENLDNRFEVSFALLELIQNKLEIPELFQAFDDELLTRTRTVLEEQTRELYFVTVKPRPYNQNIVFQVFMRPKKQAVFSDIKFTGLNRLPEKSMFRLAHLPGEATYKDLIHAQKRMLKAGQFHAVQLLTKNDHVTFKVQERNRFDVGLGLTYSEKNKATASVQLFDRMFLGRPNDWTLRFETGKEKNEALTRFVFRNFLKSPGDIIFFGQWWKENNPVVTQIPDGWGGFEESLDTITSQKYTVQYSLPLSDAQTLNLGGELILTDLNTVVRFLDDLGEEWQDPNAFNTRNTFFPISLSWSYKSFDRNSNPRNGLLTSASLEYFVPSLSEENTAGMRWSAGVTWFKSFARWTGLHRVKSGFYDPKDENFLGLGEDNPTKFYLGGGTSLRGYKANSVGPFAFDQNEGLGGNAMVFLSEEWAFHTQYYGISLASFVDAGQVWRSKDDISFSDLKVASGFGVLVDSPVGLFRVDYAWQLNEDNPETEENWSIKFGTVF